MRMIVRRKYRRALLRTSCARRARTVSTNHGDVTVNQIVMMTVMRKDVKTLAVQTSSSAPIMNVFMLISTATHSKTVLMDPMK